MTVRAVDERERERRAPAAASVTAYPDGPLVLRGDFEVRELDGTAMETGRTVALCRCGRSAVKPLCDGSHKRGALTDATGRDASEPE